MLRCMLKSHSSMLALCWEVCRSSKMHVPGGGRALSRRYGGARVVRSSSSALRRTVRGGERKKRREEEERYRAVCALKRIRSVQAKGRERRQTQRRERAPPHARAVPGQARSAPVMAERVEERREEDMLRGGGRGGGWLRGWVGKGRKGRSEGPCVLKSPSRNFSKETAPFRLPFVPTEFELARTGPRRGRPARRRTVYLRALSGWGPCVGPTVLYLTLEGTRANPWLDVRRAACAGYGRILHCRVCTSSLFVSVLVRDMFCIVLVPTYGVDWLTVSY